MMHKVFPALNSLASMRKVLAVSTRRQCEIALTPSTYMLLYLPGVETDLRSLIDLGLFDLRSQCVIIDL